MKPDKKSGFAAVESKQPFSGLALRDPSTMIPNDFSPDALNMTFYKGNLMKRAGYTLLGAQLKNGVSNSTDPVLAIISFEDINNAYHLVAITTTREYVYDAGGNVWTDITLQVSSADSPRTGTVQEGIDWCIGVDGSGKYLYITNGVDPPRRWDGIQSYFFVHGINLTDFLTCQTMAVFAGSLFLANITLSTGSISSQGYAWSNTGDFTNFNTLNAGADLLGDITGPILAMTVFGNLLSIISSDTISTVSFIGGTELFSPQTVVNGVRLLGVNAVTDVGPYQFLANAENIYVFDGTQLMRPFGDLIQAGYRTDLYLANANECQMFFDGINTQFLCIVPTQSGNNPVYMAEFNFNNFWWDRLGTDPYRQGSGRWSRHTFADNPYCFGYYNAQANLFWNSIQIAPPVTWSQMAGTWNSYNQTEGFPQKVMGSNGKVFLFNDTVTADNGVAIDGYYCTLDYTIPQIYRSLDARWMEIEIEMMGSGQVAISYSTDLGNTYTLVDSAENSSPNAFSGGMQTLDGFWRRYKFWFDTVGQTFRVKVENSSVGGTFAVRWIRAWFKAETEIGVI